MGDIDWKDVIKSALTEVFDDMKDNIVDYIDTAVVPAIDEAKEDFLNRLKEEAGASDSVWVKIRSALLSVLVSVIFKVINNVVDKVKEVS